MFVLKVITPQSRPRVLQTTIANLVTPSGQMGILSHHMPIITMVNISKMTTIEDNVRKAYAVSGGVFFFKDNEATLLADAFESQDEIDLARAIAAKERAEQRLSTQDPSIDIKRAQIALAKAINRIGLKE
jgi:F-type H+-transporting ATPase subunit epsilon